MNGEISETNMLAIYSYSTPCYGMATHLFRIEIH